MERNNGENWTGIGDSSDMGSVFYPKPISDILTEVSMIHDCSMKISKMGFYIQSLEEEMTKIAVFKSELPHCMEILQDAIETLRKEMMKWKGKEIGRPVMEEFIPMAGAGAGDDGRAKWSNEMTDRKNWLSSVQLWSTPIQYESNLDISRNQDPILTLKSGSNFKNLGGAFVPFKKTPDKRDQLPLPEPSVDSLSLSMPVAQAESLDLNFKQAAPGPIRPRPPQPNAHRKQRRCWSPELHTRFVDALQILGGPQRATPKQIRELMKVEGLSNDEVKSHLQKYRIHIRKLPGSVAESAEYAWLTGNQSKPAAAVAPGSSASPQDHLHGGGSAKVGSAASMEEDDDDKSESHSWKGRIQRGV